MSGAGCACLDDSVVELVVQLLILSLPFVARVLRRGPSPRIPEQEAPDPSPRRRPSPPPAEAEGVGSTRPFEQEAPWLFELDLPDDEQDRQADLDDEYGLPGPDEDRVSTEATALGSEIPPRDLPAAAAEPEHEPRGLAPLLPGSPRSAGVVVRDALVMQMLLHRPRPGRGPNSLHRRPSSP